MSEFLTVYVSSIAALLTIAASLVATSKWLRKVWERSFLAKPRQVTVSRPFTFYDVQAGMAALVEYARGYCPDVLVGINRGGAIVGGILGKHLGKLVHVIEVRRDFEQIDFEKAATYLSGKKVIVVDDRISTGSNMKRAYDFVQQHAAEARCVVFAWVEVPTIGQAPDAFAYRVKSREIPLPWEPGAVREWK